jgi:antigen flippase
MDRDNSSAAPPAPVGGSDSYRQILKSTAIIGGSSLVNIGFAVVRNKAIAVLLGPQGVGLMGLYNSIVDLTQTLAGLGIQQAGVRQIAEGVGTCDGARVARTAMALRRTSVALGVAGALLLGLGSVQIADFTFGDNHHVVSVALLSIAVLFRLISAGQVALVQGTRRVADLARISINGAFFSTVISIPMVYWLGTDGIAPALVAMAAASVLTSWWYSRKIDIVSKPMSLPEMSHEAASLLKLGLVFMASAFLTVGSSYAVRLIVLQADGIVAAGLYQAAWALGGLYAGFILQAMGTDFYPRLTAVSSDNEACNRLVNEQAQTSMLLAGPGVIGTLTVAPLIISLFYTPDFYSAVNLLRWICLGMMLRVVAWPMGFVILAKGARKMFFWTEIAATVVHVGTAWLLVPWLGVIGSGMAFFTLYVWHAILVYWLVRGLSGFRLSRTNAVLGVVFLPIVAIVFAATQILTAWQSLAVGGAGTILAGLFSLHMLLKLVPRSTLPASIRRFVPQAG